MRIGSDATQVYENAINISMKEMDRVLGTLGTPAAAPQPARRIDLSDSLAAQLAAKGAIAWTAVLRLQWKDYKGVPADTARESGDVGDGSRLRIRLRWREFPVRSGRGVHPVGLMGQEGGPPRLGAERARARARADAFRHHGDRSAGAAAKSLMTARHPCSLSNEARNALGTKGFSDEREIQTKYDGETGHGVNVKEQLRWERWTKAKLDSLAEFAGTVGMREN